MPPHEGPPSDPRATGARRLGALLAVLQYCTAVIAVVLLLRPGSAVPGVIAVLAAAALAYVRTTRFPWP
jgi:hypothetical protein